jgi:prepilin-type N-terminal cleavage/methylation domain-containing protein
VELAEEPKRSVHPRPSTAPGFTMVELAAVLAVIAVAVAFLIPAGRRVMLAARTAECLANQRTIALALHAYAVSNAGRFVSPRSDDGGKDGGIQARIGGRDQPMPALRWSHWWVRAYSAGGHAGLVSLDGRMQETPASITAGVLFPYVGDPGAYLSPEEPASGSRPGTPARVRSYSLNSLLGITRPNENTAYDRTFTSPMFGGQPSIDQFDTTTVSRIRRPSRMLCTIVEDDPANWNTQGWVIHADRPLWTDSPAPWRPDAIAFSCVDGSTETRSLADPSLPAAWLAKGHGLPQLADTEVPALDWKFFRDRLNPGVLPGSAPAYGGS